MPEPTYENTLYAFVNPVRLSTQQEFDQSADALLALVTPGPFVRIGFADYHPIDLPWQADLASPVLTQPSDAAVSTLLERLESRGLTYHFSVVVGMSRAQWVYEDAKREDRRNAQWYLDNLIAAPTVAAAAAARDAWVSPSRYARKVRRHMEAKVRAFASFFLQKQVEHPDTLISASGDAEAELTEDRRNADVGLNRQLIADYSPFAILEFRDWLLHTGLYSPGGPYDGQGYKRRRSEGFVQGAGADSPGNLAAFNQAFKTDFTSWSLEYFDWSLDDPIDGDPNKIPFRKYRRARFVSLPTSGPDYAAGGFDAPRAPKDPSGKFWKVWLRFRQAMVNHFTRDVASWMTTTPAPGGATLPSDRWYTHQIPGDYLNGGFPGGPNPAVRLQTSASTMETAILPPEIGSFGVTILDRFESAGHGPSGGYNRTSAFLLDAIEGLELPNWGIPEFAPSWHIDVGPDPNSEHMRAQYHRAYGAGMHMFAYTPWQHLVGTANGTAMSAFIADVRDAPRMTSYHLSREEFVRRLYLDLLGRQPTANELAARQSAIGDGTVPRPKLVKTLILSNEVQRSSALLAHYYLAFLGRPPDTSGFNSWRAFLFAGGCSPAECSLVKRQAIAASMANTNEFRSRFGQDPSPELFVTRLYQRILGRTPTAGEAAPWVNEIANGTLTKAEAARLFSETGEYATVVDRDVFVSLAYLATLRRMPLADELADWKSRLDDGLSKRSLAQVFITSPEYVALPF